MTREDTPATVTVRLFGFLRAHARENGRPTSYEPEVTPEGVTGADLARDLELPADLIEAVFRNGRVQGLEARLYPGDRVAFLPTGTPGPYRVLLGVVGQGGREGEED